MRLVFTFVFHESNKYYPLVLLDNICMNYKGWNMIGINAYKPAFTSILFVITGTFLK